MKRILDWIVNKEDMRIEVDFNLYPVLHEYIEMEINSVKDTSNDNSVIIEDEKELIKTLWEMLNKEKKEWEVG